MVAGPHCTAHAAHAASPRDPPIKPIFVEDRPRDRLPCRERAVQVLAGSRTIVRNSAKSRTVTALVVNQHRTARSRGSNIESSELACTCERSEVERSASWRRRRSRAAEVAE